MHTQQLIKASAEVVTITRFAVGDVYKRVESSDFAGAALRFGVVTDLMNNGDDCALVAVEYRPEYQGIVAEQKVWDGTKPAALYAATPAEVAQHVGELRERADQKVRETEEALVKAREARDRVARLEDAVRHGNLSAPQVVVGELATPEESADA